MVAAPASTTTNGWHDTQAPGKMQQTFNFSFLECPWDGAAMREAIEQSATAVQAVGAPVTWVLSSHDAVRPHALRQRPGR
ncbi:hypothetical protein ACWEP4_00405 [Streptomyces sp. NPDC004227]